MPYSDGYKALLADTVKLVAESTAEAITIIHDVLSPYGFDVAQRDTAANNLLLSSDRMVDFIMRFHHQEKKPDPSRPVTGGFTIGLGYALGGLIPLIPYFCVKKNQVLLALWISIGIMVVALFLFGYSKTLILAEKDRDKSTRKAVVGGIEMIVVGGVAAGVTFGVVHGINSQLAE